MIRRQASGGQTVPNSPSAEEAEGDRCFHDLKSIPGGVDAVVVGTAAPESAGVVRDCAEQSIQHVWLNRSFGSGSVSDGAADLARQNGITVIAGACPMMFLPGADIGHRCMRWLLSLTGGLPKEA